MFAHFVICLNSTAQFSSSHKALVCHILSGRTGLTCAYSIQANRNKGLVLYMGHSVEEKSGTPEEHGVKWATKIFYYSLRKHYKKLMHRNDCLWHVMEVWMKKKTSNVTQLHLLPCIPFELVTHSNFHDCSPVCHLCYKTKGILFSAGVANAEGVNVETAFLLHCPLSSKSFYNFLF